jgi:hypothetical protein
MMSENPRRETAGILTAALCALALLAAGAASAAETAARVTAVAGDTKVSGAALAGAAAIGEDTSIETGEGGNAAMLVDEDSLVELCARTIMTLTRNADTGTRVIEVGAGTTRIMVEPRGIDDQIQIHTPAAIATILGTVVYVTVDPVTGETTIASGDNDVRVESRDPTVAGSTTITGSEQVTIRPGEAPSAPTKLARRALSNLGGCLMDLHGVALGLARIGAGENAGDRLASTDGDVADLPVVGSALPTSPVVPEPGPPTDPVSPPDDPSEPQAESTGDLPDLGDLDDLPFPSGCDDVPSDGCFPFPGEQYKQSLP